MIVAESEWRTPALPFPALSRARAGGRAGLESKAVDLRSGGGGREHFAVALYQPLNRLTPFSGACKIHAACSELTGNRTTARGPQYSSIFGAIRRLVIPAEF